MGSSSEPRSFRGNPEMGELTPVDPTDLTDREVAVAALRAAQQTHNCLEVHIAETKLAHLDASEKRIKMADDVLGVKTTVAHIQADVRELALGLGVKKPVEGEQRPKASTGLPWKDVGKITLSILGAIGGLIFIYQAIATIWPPFHQYVMSLSPT